MPGSANVPPVLTIGVILIATIGPSIVFSQEKAKPSEESLPRIYSSRFSPDGRRALIVSNYVVRIVNVDTGETAFTLEGHTEFVKATTFSPNGKYVFTGSGREGDMGRRSGDNSLRQWDAQSGREVRRLALAGSRLRSIQLSGDGSRCLTVDGVSQFWNVVSGEEIHRISGLSQGFGFGPSGKLLGGPLRTGAGVWDAATGKEVCRLTSDEPDKRIFKSATISPDDKLVATASGKIGCLWDVATGKLVRTLTGHTSFVLQASFSRDGKRLMTVSDDGTIRFWMVADGDTAGALTGPGPFEEAIESGDGQRVLARWHIDRPGSRVVGSSLFDVDATREIKRFPEERFLLGFNAAGTQFLTSTGVVTRLRRADNGELVHEFK